MSEGVRGARGLVDRVAEGIGFDWFWEATLPLLGLFMARVDWNELPRPDGVPSSTAWISTVFTNTTWQVSG
jgi:hypothetical protein